MFSISVLRGVSHKQSTYLSDHLMIYISVLLSVSHKQSTYLSEHLMFSISVLRKCQPQTVYIHE